MCRVGGPGGPKGSKFGLSWVGLAGFIWPKKNIFGLEMVKTSVLVKFYAVEKHGDPVILLLIQKTKRDNTFWTIFWKSVHGVITEPIQKSGR